MYNHAVIYVRSLTMSASVLRTIFYMAAISDCNFFCLNAPLSFETYPELSSIYNYFFRLCNLS